MRLIICPANVFRVKELAGTKNYFTLAPIKQII